MYYYCNFKSNKTPVRRNMDFRAGNLLQMTAYIFNSNYMWDTVLPRDTGSHVSTFSVKKKRTTNDILWLGLSVYFLFFFLFCFIRYICAFFEELKRDADLSSKSIDKSSMLPTNSFSSRNMSYWLTVALFAFFENVLPPLARLLVEFVSWSGGVG